MGDKQSPWEKGEIIEIAEIQSTESSYRIEGIVTTNARLKQLVADKTTPKNRDKELVIYISLIYLPTYLPT